MKNSLDVFKSRFQQAGVSIKLEDRTMQVIKSEEQKEKRLKKNKLSLPMGHHQKNQHTYHGSPRGAGRKG